MLCKLEDWLEDYPILEKVYDWFKYGVIGKLEDLHYNIKWAYQRVVRGYDDRSAWDVGYAVSQFTIPLLKNLRDNGHTYAPDLTPTKWKNVLNKIIYSMEQIMNDTDSPRCECSHCTGGFKMVWDKNKEIGTVKHNIKFNPKDKLHKQYNFKTKKYYKRVQEGFTLFGKYFQHLWD